MGGPKIEEVGQQLKGSRHAPMHWQKYKHIYNFLVSTSQALHLKGGGEGRGGGRREGGIYYEGQMVTPSQSDQTMHTS